ncbi:hypothetical protein FRC01_001932 [Tulasnella sp. 417]|nr:hypothetical protein FRC01_001932 [Tulasnella sp. 417]
MAAISQAISNLKAALETLITQAGGDRLNYPTLVCVQLSQAVWAPLECCEVTPGQFYNKALSPDQTRQMIEFSTLRPDGRLRSIRNGLQALGYNNNPCLQEFGMSVERNPMTIAGRILPTPTLIYGRNATIQPRNGHWNMQGKTLYQPAIVRGCAIIVYDKRFRDEAELHLKQNLFDNSRMLGIQGMPPDPPILRKDATGGQYGNHLKEVAMMHKQVKGNMPNLIIVVLPDSSEDIYVRIKNAGDIKIGVVTQCLRAFKCTKGSSQYYSNVCLKINAKLGGINVSPKIETIPILKDVALPTIVIGAWVGHPGPGDITKPSFAAVVGSLDSGASKYVATMRPQPCRVEMIENLTDMIAHVIKQYMKYRKEVEKKTVLAPQRILLYRKGISEGQFKMCRELEITQIFKACDRIGIPRPKLTFVIVGRHHHIRY